MQDAPFANPIARFAPAPASATPSSTGSRRRRLWELPTQCHCPVIGVGLPLATLRRIVAKVDGEAPADDYAIHVAAVDACQRRGPLADALQRELDQRHALIVRRFVAAKSADAVASAWREHVARGETAGALWAALTHPRCDAPTQEAIHHDIHMLQHRAAEQVCGDQARITALNEALARAQDEILRLRERHRLADARGSDDRQTRLDEVNRLRVELAARDATIRHLQAARDATASQAADRAAPLERAAPADRAGPAEPVARPTRRARDRRERLAGDSDGTVVAAETIALDRMAVEGPVVQGPAAEDPAVEDPAVENPAIEGPTVGVPVVEGLVPASPTLASPTLASPTLDSPTPDDGSPIPARPEQETVRRALESRAVLCVGGMHRKVAAYRQIVERHGGRFTHHDGGREDSVHRLDAHLAAADLVICQAGCISHSAYWLVKDHCKRTGKRCVYLQKPSTSALARSLATDAAAI